MSKFWEGMTKASVVELLDKIMLGKNTNGETVYADINQIRLLLGAFLTGQIIPTKVEPGANLGAPEEPSIVYAPAGTYHVDENPAHDIVLEGNLNMLLWDGSTWDELEIPVEVDLSPYTITTQVVNNNLPDFYSLLFTSGAYRSSVSAVNFEVVSSLVTSYLNYIPALSGQQFAFEGLFDSLNAGNVGVLFDAGGNFVTAIPPTSFVAVSGGHVFTVPVLPTVRFVGFNIRNVDAPNIKIQRGNQVLSGRIKPELIDPSKIITPKTITDNDLLNGVTGVKKSFLFNNISFLSGFYANSGTGFPVTASATTSHSELRFPVVPGDVIFFEGLADSLSASNVGKFFDAAGAPIESIVTANLTVLPSGRSYTVPVIAGLATVGFNIRNVDLTNVRIRKNNDALLGRIKSAFVDLSGAKLSEILNDNDTLTGLNGVKKVELFANLSFATGFYANSGTGFPITASATTSHSEKRYPITAGAIIEFTGLVDSLNASNVGKFFDAAGVPLGNVTTANLVAITGGHRYVVQSLASLAFVGFNARNVDVPNISIKINGELLLGKVKPELVDSVVSLPHLGIEKFAGKTGVAIGDSILTDQNGYATLPFHSLLKEWLNMSLMTNNGKSGTGLVRPFSGVLGVVNRLSSLPATVDYWWLWVSMNDFTASVTNSVGTVYPNGLPLGAFMNYTEADKETSFYGALHFVIKSLTEKYPLASGVVMSCTPRGTLNLLQPSVDPENPANTNFQRNWGRNWYMKYLQAIREVSQHYSIPFLDLYSGSNLLPWIDANNTAYFDDADRIHPNNAGHEKIAAKVFSFSIAEM